MKRTFSKIIVVIMIALLAYLFWAYDLKQYLTLDYLKLQQRAFEEYYAVHPVSTPAVYVLIYILVTALSLPGGAVVMTLAGGALFGLILGTILISFASTIGATLAFLTSRFLLQDYIQKKFGDKLKTINQGVEKDGSFYLFTLRLVPYFPFFIINLLMGLTPIRTTRFYLVSQIGMLAGTIVYVNAGTQLGRLESLKGILSPGLIFSFSLLGVFPLIAKKIIETINARKVLTRFKKPKKFDYNLVVIGGGAAGLVTSYIAAAVKAKVALIEKHKMGGDCLNTGCVPSKALIRSAKMLSYAGRAKEFGFQTGRFDFRFEDLMERVQRIIQKIEPHDSVKRYTELGVDVIMGEAKIISPYEIRVSDRILTTRNIVIATGARPFVPPIKGLDQVEYLTSDNVWKLRNRPDRMVVLGGGPIGCELTQVFSRIGCKVTQVEMMPRIMGREDPEIADAIQQKFETEGIRVLTGHTAKEVLVQDGRKLLICEHKGEEIHIQFDAILVAVGRIANTRGFGLEDIGVAIAKNKTIQTDELLRTNFPNIFCAGDVAGPYQFTHTAAHQAWYASVNSLFRTFKTFKADYRVIPWATFTDPEVARVGLNETEAQEKKIEYEVTIYGMDDLDRAIADSENHGMVKVLTVPGKDRILGVTIMGPHAGDIIAEYILAMKHGLGLNKILGTIHIYPTLAEANKYAAGNWKKAHVPENLLRWVEKYHKWMRG
jgi:pyruvate/2-oxoglutarate dehydrogenase complex dihydrolipoamide dehydrogenase (E3) component/uncharacterized membrane protein YdjX (TVP38/TMEM64 family)